MKQKKVLSLLTGGDRRSIGGAGKAAAMVRKSPQLFRELIAGLWSPDPLVRMRAADAAEKATRTSGAALRPFKKELLGLLNETMEKEVRWHLAQLVPRLPLNANDRARAVAAFEDYLKDPSSIVKTFALQGLADLARHDPGLRPGVIEILEQAARAGTPAMKARSRKLLLKLESSGISRKS
jgi:HEAT repeat protein